MQQRQYRPGDVVDDYCPRERRITGHAIVAMVDSDIQRTRCVVCDAEHEFKNARLPAPRRKASTAALFSQVLDNIEAPPGRPADPATPGERRPPGEARSAPEPILAAPSEPPPAETAPTSSMQDDRPFRRSLIRAQLPRPEGQAPPARAIPEFTMHQPQNLRARRGGRFRHAPGAPGDFGGPMRGGRPAGQAHGNGTGHGQGGRRRRRRKKH